MTLGGYMPPGGYPPPGAYQFGAGPFQPQTVDAPPPVGARPSPSQPARYDLDAALGLGAKGKVGTDRVVGWAKHNVDKARSLHDRAKAAVREEITKALIKPLQATV